MSTVTRQQLYALIAAQLDSDGFPSLAAQVSETTCTPPRSVPPGRLLGIVQQGIAASGEKDVITGAADGWASDDEDLAVGGASRVAEDWNSGAPTSTSSRGIESFETERSQALAGSPRNFPPVRAGYYTCHKGPARCAKYSADGRLIASGSGDNSIKVLEVSRIGVNRRDGDVGEEAKPVIRNYFDHAGPVTDVDFHPWSPLLASASKDKTVKFFDLSKSQQYKRASRFLQDTHPVRSIHFHPSGDYILASTDHHMIRLYDVASFASFTTGDASSHHSAAVNQVRYAPAGSDVALYASASKDGDIKFWDAVTSKLVHTVARLHSGAEIVSLCWSRSGRYLLSNGKDSTLRLIEAPSGRTLAVYAGHACSKSRLQATFYRDEDFVLCSDENSPRVIAWDTRRGDVVWQSAAGHSAPVRWIAPAPAGDGFVTCGDGTDMKIRYWYTPGKP